LEQYPVNISRTRNGKGQIGMDRSTGESFFCWAFTGNYHNIISICVIGKGSPDITCILKVAAVFIRYRRVNEDDFAESIRWIPTCMNLFFNGSNLLIYSFVNRRWSARLWESEL